VIPQGFLQELVARTDLVEVIGRHVELKRSGINLMGLCPFHAERSPSFSVNPGKGFYYCFGCGAGGDAIRFLTDHLGMSFVEAVRELAQRAGLAVPEEQVSPEERERRETLRQRRQSLGELLQRAADFYRAQLKASPRAIEYLKRRGLTGAVAARFGLGYAPPGWRTLAGVFGQYDDPRLEEAGLVRSREVDADDAPESDGAAGPADADAGAANATNAASAANAADQGPRGERSRYDWFRHRVMFPIRNVAGEVIGFGGRVLDDSKPKYINSPETPLFSKGRELYGLFEARQALREHGCALVVEGYMDVVALAQHGFGNAVATLGTACTADHVMKLFRFTDAVVFAFDGDAAGRRAAARALEAALPHATDLRSVKFLFLPSEHDPDSYVRELGAEAFRQAVAAAVPLSKQLLEQAGEGQDLDAAEGRARLLAQARPLWQALPDGALKRQVFADLAAAGRLATEDLAALWGTGATASRWERGAAITMRPLPRLPQRRAPAGNADLALRLLLLHSDWWDRLSAEDHQLLHELGGAHGQAVAWLEQQIMEHGPQTWAALAEAATGQPWEVALRPQVDAAAQEEQQPFGDLEIVVHRLWAERRKAEVRELIASGRTDAEHLAQVRALSLEAERHDRAARGSHGEPAPGSHRS
jgi:DNA primase